MKLTQDEFNQIIDLLGDIVIAQKILHAVSCTPINTAPNESETNTLLTKYHNTIATLCIKYDVNVPSDAYTVYDLAILLSLHERISQNLDCNNGMNTLALTLKCQLDIECIRQQLHKDFSDKDEVNVLHYSGKHPVTSPKEISLAASYKRSETLYEALSQHPYAFFTQSVVGLSTLALGAGLAGYAIHKYNSK